MTVALDPSVTFHFGSPLSITLLVVSNAAEETLWEFIAEEFEPVETQGGSFQSWPIDQAPPEMLALLGKMQERADQELAEHGPRKRPLHQVTYGELPAGYREENAPKPLKPGEYGVVIFAEQGNASAKFTIAG